MNIFFGKSISISAALNKFLCGGVWGMGKYGSCRLGGVASEEVKF
jgi:hypothetical protein